MRPIHFGLVALTMIPAAASAAEFNATLATSVSSGRYGGPDVTATMVRLYGVQGNVGGWRLQMTIPRLQVTGGAGRAFVNGNLVPARSGRRTSGDGDMTVKLAHDLPFRQHVVDLEMAVQFKLPTGARGLTTGSTDVTMSMQASKTFGRVTPFASIGYQHVGDMKGFRLADGWTASAGGTMMLGRNFLMLSYEATHAVVPGAPSRSLLAVVARPIGGGWSVSLYASKGFSSGAPDRVSGLALTHAFGRR